MHRKLNVLKAEIIEESSFVLLQVLLSGFQPDNLIFFRILGRCPRLMHGAFQALVICLIKLFSRDFKTNFKQYIFAMK